MIGMSMSLKHISGFSLLEVLMSFMLLSLALLGLDAMEMAALRDSRGIFYFNEATQQLQNLSERLRVLGVVSGLSEQIALWNQENQNLLPQANGIVSGVYPVYHVTISWGEQKTNCRKNTIGVSGCIAAEIQL